MKKLNKKKLALLTACVISSIANIGFAEEAAQEDLDAYVGEDYVVTATRTQIEKKEVPSAVEVISQEDLKQMGAYNLQDALQYATSLDVRTSGMTGNAVSIRGMSTNKTLILVDGKRMADEDTPQTQNVYVLNRINMADVERIEIIRGAGSAIYGSDAMGGVINIITKKATNPQGLIGFSTGTKETNEYFNYASGRQGKLAIKFDGRLTRERKIDTKGGYTNMYGNKQYFNADFDYDLGNNRGIDLSLGYMKEKLSQDWTSVLMFSKYDQERKDVGLNYYGKDSKNDYHVRAYYSVLDKDQTASSKLFSSMGLNNLNVTDDTHKFEKFIIEAKNSYKLDDSNVLTYGADYKKDKIDRTYGFANYKASYGPMGPTFAQGDFSYKNVNRSMENYSAYIQDEMKVNEKLLLIPAVHFDYSKMFGSEWTAKLGSTYKLNDSNRIKFNVGTGYRAPSIYEMYGDMSKWMMGMQVNVIGNPDLKPEKSFNVDVSYEAEQGKSNFKLTPFYSEVKDLINSKTIDNGTDPTTGTKFNTSTYENIQKAKLYGTEFEAGYNFDDHWNVSANYTYLDAIDDADDSRLEGRSRHTAVIKLAYTDAKENPLTVALYSKWYGDYYYSESAGNYTFNTTNFIVNKQVNSNFRVYAGVDNIFNKEFEYNSNSNRTYLIDGRMWRAGAEWTF